MSDFCCCGNECKTDCMLTCGKCSTMYCSAKCQIKDWEQNDHIKMCKLIASQSPSKRMRVQSSSSEESSSEDEISSDDDDVSSVESVDLSSSDSVDGDVEMSTHREGIDSYIVDFFEHNNQLKFGPPTIFIDTDIHPVSSGGGNFIFDIDWDNIPTDQDEIWVVGRLYVSTDSHHMQVTYTHTMGMNKLVSSNIWDREKDRNMRFIFMNMGRSNGAVPAGGDDAPDANNEDWIMLKSFKLKDLPFSDNKSGPRQIRLTDTQESGLEAFNLCLNETDPFTLDEFSGMRLREVLSIGKHCFHLPSLYNWIVNESNTTNPLTNIDFSSDEIDIIKRRAVERYSIIVTVTQISGKVRTYELTSLMSVQRLFIYIYNARFSDASEVSTPFQLFTHILHAGVNFAVKIGATVSNFAVAIATHGKTQLVDLNFMDVLKITEINMLTPPAKLKLVQDMFNYADEHNLPTDDFQYKIDSIQNILNEHQQRNYARKRFKEMIQERRNRHDRQILERPENALLVNISINSIEGAAYGIIPVYLNENAELRNIERQVRDYIGDDIFMDGVRLYIYAGIAYGASSTLMDLSNFQDGNTIHLVTYGN